MHATMDKKRKLHIFESLVLSKRLYGMQTIWLNTAARRRLDGFQARCLRRILKVLPSFISRVSNATVLQRASHNKASSMLLCRALKYFGKLAVLPLSEPVRQALFQDASLDLRTHCGGRRQGRPRQFWPEMVRASAVKACGSEARMISFLQSPPRNTLWSWNKVVEKYCLCT